jgi:iron(III) transport system substrate-binding protein
MSLALGGLQSAGRPGRWDGRADARHAIATHTQVDLEANSRMTRKYRFLVAALVGAAMTAGMLPAAGAQELNIYSSRHYQTDERLYSEFEKQTGIKINRIDGKGDVLIERIASEGANTPADLLITVDAGRLWRAEQEGLFQPVDSAILDKRVPENLRHPDGLWFGFSTRARVIYYNKELVDPTNLESYEDLADDRYEGLVCIRSSSNIYNLSLMSSLIAAHGEQAAEEWAKGVVENFARKPQGGDTDQIRAVAAGECGVAVGNTYYYARLVASDDPEDNAVAGKVGIVFPNQDGRGTHVNVSGAGVLKHASNPENAIKFLEYLTSEEAQRYFADGNNEYPVVKGVAANSVVQSLGEFKSDDLNVAVYGENQPMAQKVFDRAGWQ